MAKITVNRITGQLWRTLSGAWDNPITTKDLRMQMRGWRAPVILCVYLIILSCFTSIIYFAVTESATQSLAGPYAVGRTIGRTLFYSTYMLLLTMVVFLSPAFTAGTISGERERKTLDILITTLLPTRTLVLGKLTSALAYIVLLIVAALPVQSLAYFFGGIVLSEVAIGTILLLATTLAVGSLGIFISSIMRSSLAATVLTYATVLVIALGVPGIVAILFAFLGPLLDLVLSDMGWLSQAIAIYAGGLLICTNPFATAVVTKVLEEENGSLFFFTAQVTGGDGVSHTLPLISPWIVYTLLYTAMAILLVVFAVAIIERKRG